MKHLKYITLMLLVVLSAACEQMQLPEANLEIKREKMTDITDQSAVIEVEFYPIDATIQKVEAYYTNVLKKDMVHVSGFKYRVELSNLNSDTEYQVYYKVKNAFSSVIVKNFGVFRTAKKGTTNEDEVATPEYVDLGLSVKWATFNVGATKPEEYGDYFAWGETEPKSTYSWSNYKWCNGSSSTLTKYNTDSIRGTVDNKTQLELSDDAAYANWGGSWRMPTDAELTELRTECTWAWATQNGVKGYKVTSKSNGNSIFLPAAGYRSGSLLNNASSSGKYWSSSLNPGSPGNAYLIDLSSSSEALGYYVRYYGQSVRPVYSAQVTVPTVTTSTVTQITETTAVAGGNVTSDGGASVTERGVVYSTTQNPTTANSKVASGNGTGAFTCNLTGLQPNTTYYIRAYAVNSIGTSYGEQESFTTKEEVVATPEYVDLGLSVKWATFNVGANKPEDYGDYFAWGETEPKSTYSWSTYKWCNGSSTTLTKYCTSSSNGTVDNKKTLELSDDAAYANWGGEWRTPTDAELTELRTQCTWTWTTQNGVNGYKVTGTNGNSIFLPAAGYRSGSSLSGAGSYGYYWSSTLEISSSSLALNVGFNYSYVSSYHYDRYFGRSVRPVYGPQVTVPTVTTSTVTQITETTAMAGGNVTSDGGASVTERGVVYSTSSNPTTASNKVASGSGTGAFTCNLTGLQPNTTYYVRAYAVNSKGTSYGEEVSFTTNEKVFATPEYVDLGLSVKWATFNVGANKPEDYGDYFAWGETEPKEVYDWSTYKWCNGSSSSLTKYCISSSYGTVDNKTTLELSDDAARANLGGNWRMPTKAEQDELREQCTWTWTSQNGVKGYRVTGTNGNSIFLPAAGFRVDSSLSDAGSYGYYWSGSLDSDYYAGFAYDLIFSSSFVGWGSSFRCDGRSVRPVYGQQKEDTNNEKYFSVSNTKKVTFSKGNLQYHPANNKWRFAENQTDYIGDANSNISSSFNGWLDLFGWSTSATNFGVSTSTSDSDYSGSFVDWGTNQIGADAPNTWRTLTAEEWSYLLNTRTNASSLKGVAQVNGVNGLILLPDNWVCPAGVTFKSGFHSSVGVDYYAAYQTFTADQWSKLESAGAVFLPAAGRRIGSDVNLVQDRGRYWSATENVYCLGFSSDVAYMGFDNRYRGLSVRLVKDL